MKFSSLKTNLILSTAYQLLTILLPFITAPYASRVLGVDGTGIYSYTHSYSLYFSIFAALGTVSYGTREIARHRENREKRSVLFWEIVLLLMSTSLCTLAIWGVWTLLNHTYRVYYALLTFSLMATMFDISWLYAGMEQFRYTITQNTLFKVCGTIAIFVFVKKDSDLWVYVLIMSLTTLLANISMWVYLPKFVDRVPIKQLHIMRHLRETLVYFIPTIATSVYTILDKTLIGLITQDTKENGYYEQATKMINMAKTVSFAGLNAVMMSRMSFLFAEGKIEEIKERLSQSMEFILCIGIGLCFGLMGTAKRFVPFYFGPGYEKTISLIQIMAPLSVVIGVSNCLGSQYYNPAGLRAKSAKFIVAGSVINLVLNIALIPCFSSHGAAFATVIAECVITFLYMRNCNGYYRFGQFLRQLSRKLIAGVIMLITILWLGRYVANNLLAIIVQVVAGMAVYCICLLIMHDSFITGMLLPFVRARFHFGKKN